VEQLPTTDDVCTYWPTIRPLIPSGSCYVACFLSMNTRQCTCLSGTTLHAIINPWWNSEPFGGAAPSASFSPTNKLQLWRIVCPLYAIKYVWDRVVFKCESGNFRLHNPRRHGSTRPFVGTEYISLTQPDMDYLVRVIPILQQHLHDYIIAMPDMLSYVTSSHRQHMLNLRLMQALSLITTVCTRNL